MGWIDRLTHLPDEFALHLRQGFQNLKNHAVADKVREFQEWKRLQGAEHARLDAERQRLLRQKEALLATSGRLGGLRGRYVNFPGMSPEQRQQRLKQLSSQMPGRTQVFWNKPWVKGAAGVLGLPLHFGWRAIKGGASASSHALGAALRGGRAVATHVTPGSNTWLIIIAIFYHLWVAFNPGMTVMTRFAMNMVLLILVVLVIFDPSERNGDSYRVLFFFILILEILIPYITSTVSIIREFDWIRLYLANSFLIWTWVYYAVFVRGQNLGGFTRFCRIMVVLFWLGVIFSSIGTMFVDFSDVELETASTDQFMAFRTIWMKSSEGWSTLIVSITGTAQTVKDTVDLRIKQATGEYYYGVVEENENEKLGVYLEDLQASQTTYEEFETINVYATLHAYTLDDTIDVSIGCYAGKEEDPTPGEVYPDESFEVYNLQEEELDCRFERLNIGTNKITFDAEFNFETIGYLKRYFVDRDAKVAATREGIDLLNEYQILDTNPVAHYTNGPVRIGMGPEEALIGISETYTVKPRLAVTIDSGWDGVIEELHELVLVIPKEMSLDTDECSDTGWDEYTVEECVDAEVQWQSSVYRDCDQDQDCVEEFCSQQDEDYNVYHLSVSGDSRYQNIEDYKTISCRMNIDDVAGALGATPIATHYFYAKARYDYKLAETTKVVVEEEAPLAGEDDVSAEKVPSYTYDERDEELHYIFNRYGDELFAEQDDHNMPVCLQAAFIAQISDGDPNYYENGRYGLFGLTKSMFSFAGYSGTDYYDAEKNLGYGVDWFVKFIAESDAVADFNDEQLWKQYYSELYITNDMEVEDKDSADLSRFVTLTNTYIETCEEEGLDTTLGRSDEDASDSLDTVQDAFNEGSVTYPTEDDSQRTVSTGISYNGDSFTMGISRYVVDTEEFFSDKTTAKLTVGTESLADITDSGADRWQLFDSYELFAILFDAAEMEIYYRYVDDFVVNVDLVEDTEVELIEDWLYIEYDGSNIEISVADEPEDARERKTICDVTWYEHLSYATCADEGITDSTDLPGLVIRNRGTDPAYLGTGFAQVQLDWSNSRQLDEVLS